MQAFFTSEQVVKYEFKFSYLDFISSTVQISIPSQDRIIQISTLLFTSIQVAIQHQIVIEVRAV